MTAVKIDRDHVLHLHHISHCIYYSTTLLDFYVNTWYNYHLLKTTNLQTLISVHRDCCFRMVGRFKIIEKGGGARPTLSETFSLWRTASLLFRHVR